jgi:hypothetical protein
VIGAAALIQSRPNLRSSNAIAGIHQPPPRSRTPSFSSTPNRSPSSSRSGFAKSRECRTPGSWHARSGSIAITTPEPRASRPARSASCESIRPVAGSRDARAGSTRVNSESNPRSPKFSRPSTSAPSRSRQSAPRSSASIANDWNESASKGKEPNAARLTPNSSPD